MIEKIRDFFEGEYQGLVETNKRKMNWFNLKEGKRECISRMLGVAYFAQNFDGVNFNDIETLYNEYKAKVEAIE